MTRDQRAGNHFRIVARPSHGGQITDYFFLVNGQVRQASYDRGDILNFAQGYSGRRDIPIEPVPATWTSAQG